MPGANAATADLEEGLSPLPQASSWARNDNFRSDRRQSVAGASSAEDNLILTPSKLRLDGGSFAAYCTASWLMNFLFAVLLLLKVSEVLIST